MSDEFRACMRHGWSLYKHTITGKKQWWSCTTCLRESWRKSSKKKYEKDPSYNREYMGKRLAKIDNAMEIIAMYGDIDGAHHKQWCLDQIARILLGKKYDGWVEQRLADECKWDVGIPP